MEKKIREESKSGPYQVYDALEQLLTVYLVERDEAKVLAGMTEDIYSIGTGKREVALNRKEFAVLLKAELLENSKPIDFHIDQYHEKRVTENYYQCYCSVQAALTLDEGEQIVFQTRLTAGFIWEAGKWLANELHMSEPSANQEDYEFFPLRYGRDTLLKLDHSSQFELVKLMKEVIPGGVMGGYYEPGFPLYIVNDEILNLLGYTYESFVEDIDGLIKNTIHPDDREFVERAVDGGLADGNEYKVEYRMKKKDGSYLWVFDRGRVITAEDGRNVIISVVMDISESVKSRERLTEEATKDSLTGIYNRRAARKLIHGQLKKKGRIGFLILDIDSFKLVNDSYGHQTGDKILVLLAVILKEVFRPQDICARLGGDEFIVFLPDLEDEKELKVRIGMVMRMYRERAVLLCPDMKNSVSVGAVFGNGLFAFEHVYDEADQLLYQVKKEGKNGMKVMRVC